MLILRDADFVSTRFDPFEQGLGLAPEMLTRHLESLVEAGMLERSACSRKATSPGIPAMRHGPRFPACACRPRGVWRKPLPESQKAFPRARALILTRA
jgi:hypothetical protein